MITEDKAHDFADMIQTLADDLRAIAKDADKIAARFPDLYQMAHEVAPVLYGLESSASNLDTLARRIRPADTAGERL